MYRLQNQNIVREVVSEQIRDMLLENGYELLEDTDEKDLPMADKLNAMNMTELKKLADEKGIEYDKNIKKDTLIEMLKNADSEVVDDE